MDFAAKQIVEVGMEDSSGQVPQCRRDSSSGDILLMEGEPGMARRCRKFLEWEEFSVIVAGNRNSALQFLEERGASVKLIVASVALLREEMTDFVSTVKKLAPGAQILLMSSNGQRDVSSGDFKLVETPFYPESLVQKVMRLLGGSPRSLRTSSAAGNQDSDLIRIGKRIKSSWDSPLG